LSNEPCDASNSELDYLQRASPDIAPRGISGTGTKCNRACNASAPAKAARAMPDWVRVGNNELDYVAQDVTVCYFTPSHAIAPPHRAGNAA